MALTDTEKRYANIEREMLAAVVVVASFNILKDISAAALSKTKSLQRENYFSSESTSLVRMRKL